MCMTDALGEWALFNESEGHPQWALLREFCEIAQFEDFIVSERGKRLIRLDDVTLVTVTFDDWFVNELPDA